MTAPELSVTGRVRFVSQALRGRFSEQIEVALWAEIDRGNPAEPAAWIVTAADRPGHEWRYATEAQALRHYNQLKDSRTSRAPGRYAPPPPPDDARIRL